MTNHMVKVTAPVGEAMEILDLFGCEFGNRDRIMPTYDTVVKSLPLQRSLNPNRRPGGRLRPSP